jgi:hypothetical protein
LSASWTPAIMPRRGRVRTSLNHPLTVAPRSVAYFRGANYTQAKRPKPKQEEKVTMLYGTLIMAKRC